MTIFYHVSTDLKHNGEFEPRIPSCRHRDAEDDTTPRVSVGISIENCLTAIPNGGLNLDQLNIDRRGYYLVYKINTDKLGISEEHIVSAEELYEKDLVRDASFTNEHWITIPFSVPEEDRFLIRLKDWEEDSEDVLPHSIYAVADEKYEGNYLSAFENEYGKLVPCSTSIRDINVVHEEVKEDEEVSLYFDTEEERDVILMYLKENIKAEIEGISMDEITFIVKESVNLRPLFMLHSDVAMMNI